MSEPQTTESNQQYRDKLGHFLPGNPGSPGNPNIVRLAEYRQALREAITPADLKEVLLKLLTAAKEGEQWAVLAVLDRCLGKPVQALEVSKTEPTDYTFTFKIGDRVLDRPPHCEPPARRFVPLQPDVLLGDSYPTLTSDPHTPPALPDGGKMP